MRYKDNYSREICHAVLFKGLPESALNSPVYDVSRTTVLKGSGESTSYHSMVTICRDGKRLWRGTLNDFEHKTLQGIVDKPLILVTEFRHKTIYVEKQ